MESRRILVRSPTFSTKMEVKISSSFQQCERLSNGQHYHDIWTLDCDVRADEAVTAAGASFETFITRCHRCPLVPTPSTVSRKVGLSFSKGLRGATADQGLHIPYELLFPVAVSPMRKMELRSHLLSFSWGHPIPWKAVYASLSNATPTTPPNLYFCMGKNGNFETVRRAFINAQPFLFWLAWKT